MLNKKIIKLIFVIGYIFSLQTLHCQLDTINNSYFANLKKSLTKDSNVKEVKLVQEKILKGQGFIQSMYVKFKDDPKGRFYNVGKEFIYKPENGKYWAWNGDKNYIPDYGYLYSWEIAQNVCPIGWHLPDKSEYEELLQNYKGDSILAYNDLSLKGNSGFDIKGGGVRIPTDYLPITTHSALWTMTERSKKKAWALIYASFQQVVVLSGHYNKNNGLSIRCVKDE